MPPVALKPNRHKGDDKVWWTGCGPLFLFSVALGAVIGSDAGGETGGDIGVIVGGILLWFIGRYMNRDVLYLHREGNEYLPRDRHTLYSVPVQYWSVPFVLWGIGDWIFGWEG